MKKILFNLLIVASVITLSACSTSKEELLPTNGISMKDTWNGSVGGHLQGYRDMNGRSIDPVNYVSYREQKSYTRTAENEVDNLFPRLPNPNLVMYIYPHLTNSNEQMPIPGYSTVIPFYGRVQYAQPGERTKGI